MSHKDIEITRENLKKRFKTQKNKCSKRKNAKKVSKFFYRCAVSGCSSTFNQKKAWVVHHLVKHKTVKYQFDICKKVFATPSSYKDHKLLHKPCNYKCHKCDKKSVYPGGLRIHRNFHNRTRKYKCKAEGCSHRYKWPQDILRHMKIHLQETLCRVCQYSTYEVCLYRCHVILHTSRLPYKCRKCPEHFKHTIQCY